MEKEIYYEIEVYKIIEDKIKMYGVPNIDIKKRILYLKLLEEPNLVQLVQAACVSSDVNYE